MLEKDEIFNPKEGKSLKSSSNSPLLVSTPKAGRKLSGLSLLLDEEARIKSSASVSPVNGSNNGVSTSGIKPTSQFQFDSETKTSDNSTIAPPVILVEQQPPVVYGSFFESYKSDDMEMLPDHFQLPLTPHPPITNNANDKIMSETASAPAKSDKGHRAFSFDFEEEENEENGQAKHEKDGKDYLTCEELIHLIVSFANNNDEFAASPSSRSLWHMTSVRLIAADEKGEPLNDLPLDLSATADVLNLGVTDFIIVDRYGDRTLMHIRIEGLLHDNLPYAGTTTSAMDMPYTSLNFAHDHDDSSHHDEVRVATERHRQLLLRSQQGHSDSGHETSLTLGSSEDSSGSSFDTMRRQTSLESLAPDVITIFQMDTDDKTAASQTMDQQQHPSALSSPSSVEHNAQSSRKKKRRHRRKQEKPVSTVVANSHNSNRFSYGVVSSLSVSSPVTRGRSSSGNLLISCRRWGTDRWRVAQQIAVSPHGSVLWDKVKPPEKEKNEEEEDKFTFSLSEREEEKNFRPFQFNTMKSKVNDDDDNDDNDDDDRHNETSGWFDDFSYCSQSKVTPQGDNPSTTMNNNNNNNNNNKNINGPFPSKHIHQSCPATPLRKPRASSSLSASYNSGLQYTPTHSIKDKDKDKQQQQATNNKQSSFFNNARNEELLKQHYLEKQRQQQQQKPLFLNKKPSSSIILVPAAGDPSLERRHSERPYDEDHDVIDILKYQRHTPSVLALEKAGALQTIFPHTSQPFHAKFSPKYTPNNNINNINNNINNNNINNNNTSVNTSLNATDNAHFRERRIRAMSSLSNTSTRSDTGYDSDCEHFVVNPHLVTNSSSVSLTGSNSKKKKEIVHLEHVDEVLRHSLGGETQTHRSNNNLSTKSDDGYSYDNDKEEEDVNDNNNSNFNNNDDNFNNSRSSSEHSVAAILSAAVLSSVQQQQQQAGLGQSHSHSFSANQSHPTSTSNSTSTTAAMLLSYKSLAAQRSASSQQSSVNHNFNNSNGNGNFNQNKSTASNRSVSPLPSSTSSQQGSEHTPAPSTNNSTLSTTNNGNVNGNINGNVNGNINGNINGNVNGNSANNGTNSGTNNANISVNNSSYMNTSNFGGNTLHRPQHQRHHHHHHPHLSSHSHSHSHQSNFIHHSPHHFNNNNNNNNNNNSAVHQKPPTHHRKHTTPPLRAPPQTTSSNPGLDDVVNANSNLSVPPPLHLFAPAEDTTASVTPSVPPPQYSSSNTNNNNNNKAVVSKKTSKSAVSSGYSTPTYSSRTSFTSFLSPTANPAAVNNTHSDSRRGSSSNFFGRLYDSLVRMSSPAIAMGNENNESNHETDQQDIHETAAPLEANQNETVA